MALLDPETGTILVRVIYDGPSAGGKTTSLRTLAEQLPRHRRGKLCSFSNQAGNTLYFDLLEFEGGMIEGQRIRFQITTVPGAPMLQQRRFVLLTLADVVIFVTGASRAELTTAAQDLAMLHPFLRPSGEPPVGLLVQANRRDQDDALPLAEVENRLGTGLPIIETVASRGEGVKKAFIDAVRLAADRTRKMIATRTIPVGPADMDACAALVALMDELAPPFRSMENQSALETTDLNMCPPVEAGGHPVEGGGAQLDRSSEFETQKISADRVRAMRAMQRASNFSSA